jgi:hypothetical protein
MDAVLLNADCYVWCIKIGAVHSRGKEISMFIEHITSALFSDPWFCPLIIES